MFYEHSYVLLRDGFANIRRSLLSRHRRNLPFTLAIRLTHSRLLSGEQCITCQCPITVEHVLENAEFSSTRMRHLSMKDLFENVDSQLIVDFIRDVDFYHPL